GSTALAAAHARAVGHDLERPHVVVVLEPLGTPGDAWPQTAAHVAARLGGAVPGTLCDPGDERVRALMPLRGPDPAHELQRVDEALRQTAQQERLAAGRSEPRRGLASDAHRGFTEAACAARVARAIELGGGARAYGELGVYRYLAALPDGHAPDERHAQAIATLAAYDAKRRTELLATLERHLGDRGALAATARALHPHQHASPAARPHRAPDRPGPCRRGPAVARAGAEAGAAATGRGLSDTWWPRPASRNGRDGAAKPRRGRPVRPGGPARRPDYLVWMVTSLPVFGTKRPSAAPA
ncbi:MAG: hypothetical protein JWR30_3632, partial [Conexibacter sp.]|nr:hypothetical protein [Conexibacter sp.]